MDTKNLSGLLFLLGTAALAMPGCDDDDNGDTGADTDTDGMTGTATASGTGTATASDSDTTPTSDSDTTPTSDSDTTPTSDSDSDTTPTSDSDTTPTTVTDGETETDGTTITDTDTDGGTDTDTTTTGTDTAGPNEACTGYATVYEDCYEGKDGYEYDMNVEFCETAIADGISESPACGEAVETLFGCISELSCKEFNSKEGKACAAENEAAMAECGINKG